ncbi:lysophospholipid acyltransferase family protein [Salipaludibacillus sp. CF4.18]|uniref:lysophospholipid acyltransferase family protein n=1 Tax=Salipaludibacillus sp. CF4.18 TaxID=3373081 RepID=UPI003EE59B80
MIKANRKTSFEKVFHLYNQRLLKKSFHQINITKDSYLPAKNNGIYFINHSSWWDALVLFYLNQSLLKLDAIAMMDSDGLHRFPFFSKLGAYSIDTKSRHSLVTSLQYSSEQLNRNKHLFLFP